jgi:hypothetical protein
MISIFPSTASIWDMNFFNEYPHNICQCRTHLSPSRCQEWEGFVLPTACDELCIDLCCDLGVEGRERKRVRRGHMSIFTLALTLALKPAFRFAGMPPISIYSSRVPRRRRPKPSINRGHRPPQRLLGNRRATTEESGYPKTDAAFISAGGATPLGRFPRRSRRRPIPYHAAKSKMAR